MSHRHLHAVRWLLSSPPLLAHVTTALPGFSPTLLQHAMQADLEAINASRTLQAKLIASIEAASTGSRDHRLGKYFEWLIQAWLQHSEQFRLLAANIPIRAPSAAGIHTLGELDFVVLHKPSGVQVHLEATVKFYMQTSHGWLGPNTADSLARRYQHLQQHQFPLLLHPATQHALSERGLQVEAQACLSRGRLFFDSAHLPDRTPNPTLARLPEWINPAHDRGQWCYLSALNTPAHAHSHWLPLQKNQWLLAAEEPAPGTTWLSTEKMIYHTRRYWAARTGAFSNAVPSPIQCRRQVLQPDATTPRQRDDIFFICPDDWPGEHI